ncbi:MAG: transcriptional regulator, partial [bacterium]|nr:transcriptional regulator [bacterium]
VMQVNNYNKTLSEEDSSKKIKAIVFVCLYGNPAGLDKVFEIAKSKGIHVVSDAAQAQGALIDNQPVTDFADITSYSFFPGKNLGAFGDAGAIATNNPELANRSRLLRNHGRTEKYIHLEEAYNCRIDTLQAAILQVKLKNLAQWNRHRIETALHYNDRLSKKGYYCPGVGKPGNKENRYQSVFHLYVTWCDGREALMAKLKEAGVASGIHYPVPLHLQPAYRHLEHKAGDFPVSEALAKKILSLPIDGAITPEEI